MIDDALLQAIRSVPAGAWAVGVSGGADSVALLRVLRTRDDLQLTVAHLNHQTRGEESEADAQFVETLAKELNVGCHVATRAEIEDRLGGTILPSNPSSRYRRLRFEHFRDVIEDRSLQGVILAHHADDQAETVLQRLLRGSGYAPLAGMAAHATVNGITILRPMLQTRRDRLRRVLVDQHHAWREDASNQSLDYQRNRVRAVLRDRPELTDALLELARCCGKLKTWTTATCPVLAQEFSVDRLADLPAILARQAAGRWLREQSVPAEMIDRAVTDRLIMMCTDAASAARQQFPGGVRVARRGGRIFVDR